MNDKNSKENTPKKSSYGRDFRFDTPAKASPGRACRAILVSSASPRPLATWHAQDSHHGGSARLQYNGTYRQSISSNGSSMIAKPKSPERKKKSRHSQKHAKKGNWTDEEDRLLLEWVETNGSTRWTECSRFIPNRCGKQCRERWVNILNPGIKKGEWTNDEQLILFKWLPVYTTSWSLMATALPGRTENSIKNYFYSSIRRLKSSPIVHLIYDIHVNRRTSPNDICQENHFVRSELDKLNAFGRAICEYMMGSEVSDVAFKEFVLGLLFEEGQEGAFGDLAGKARLTQGFEVRKAVMREGISETGVVLRNAQDDSQIRRRNAKAVAEVLKTLGEMTNMSYLTVFLKALEKPLQEAEDRDTANKLELWMPGCWKCSDGSPF